MGGTRTGNGGFEIDGKVYDFDVDDPNAPGLDPTNPDPGDLTVDHSVKDISRKTKSTLADYLKSTTRDNRFVIDGRYTEVTITTEHNVPQPLSDNQLNDPQFIDRTKASGTVFDIPADLKQTGPAGNTEMPLTDPATKLVGFSKGKRFPQRLDGNNLLPSVEKDHLPTPVLNYTNAVLSNNRFTSDTYKIGGKEYSRNQLLQVGPMLSLRASQEFPAAYLDNVNPVGLGSTLGAALPSPNQLGLLKVSTVLLEAKDALEHLSDNDDSPIEISISPINNQSWGALNNVEEQWSGAMNIGMIALAIAMQAALIIAFEGLGSLVDLVGSSSQKSISRNIDGTYTKGKYHSRQSSDPGSTGFQINIAEILGIHGTNFPFGDALKVGVASFFVGAQKAKSSTSTQILGTITNTLADSGNAGYIIIVSRAILRTTTLVAQQVDKISSAFSSNPISGIGGIVGLFGVIKQSKLISAINVFTMLGDAILSEDEFNLVSSQNGGPSVISSVDSIPDDVAASSVRKSRLNHQDLNGSKVKLAWSSNRVPSMYLLPDSIAAMSLIDTELGGFKGPHALSDPSGKSKFFIQSNEDRIGQGSRIPRESTTADENDVKSIESALEAEYVPFYFHDLRTNEIIGFHAFLASISDDYTVNWESVDGYGRVEPVKIYKGTGRKIGMSFYLVSTSENDFDDMWFKINKLTTMVYPQYTKGRTLSSKGGETKFVQPFSQLMGASPLIRIRLGDLFRSNYSRFALARLFGAADGTLKLDSNEVKFSGSQEIIEKIKQATKNAYEDSSVSWSLSTADWSSAQSATSSGISVSSSGPSTPDQAPTMAIDPADLPYFVFKITKLRDNSATIKPSIMPVSEIVETFNINSEIATNQVRMMTDKYASSENPSRKVIGGSSGYSVPASFLRLTQKSYKNILADAGGEAQATDVQELSKFLDVEKNAIVKSFRSIQGKGLAGVIDSINFDWYDKVTWDVRPGNKAPKMCKVTISFSPIHDISPGIDHLGYNRSPIYPVGVASGQGSDPDKAE